MADSATNVAAAITGLQSLAASGKLVSIDLTDPGVPIMNLSTGSITANATALALITTPVVKGSTPTTTPFSVTAAQVPGQLATWEPMAESRTLGAITLTDGGTPVISLSAAELAQKIQALAAITSPYQITLTDGGTPALVLAPWQISSATTAALGKVTSPFTFSVSGTLGSAGTSLLGTNTHLTGTINIVNFSTNNTTTLTGLEALFNAGHLGSYTLLNAGPPRLSVTSAVATADVDVLNAITSPYSLSQIVTAAAASSTTSPSGKFDNLTVSDTVANILADLTSLEPLAVTGKVAGVSISSGSTGFSLSAATLAANVDVFLRLNGTYSITLTDAGTPTVMLKDWQFGANNSVLTLMNAITTPYQLAVDGPIRPNIAGFFANAGTSIINKLAPNAFVVRDSTVSFTDFLPLGGTLTSWMPQLLTLTNAGKIAAIDPRNALPYFSVTPADATTYQPVLAKTSAPLLLSQVITVADLPTTSLATLDARFVNFMVRDSVANVMGALPQIQSLAAANLLGRLLFTDSEPRIVTTAASIMANADAWGTQDYDPYPVILTDSGTPTITLPSYQLGYNTKRPND